MVEINRFLTLLRHKLLHVDQTLIQKAICAIRKCAWQTGVYIAALGAFGTERTCVGSRYRRRHGYTEYRIGKL